MRLSSHKPEIVSREDQIKRDMDSMYRWTRHVYDASRKYYLLGRDRLIENMNAKDNELICEVGCGTARNLIKMAKAYPCAEFYGLDASEEMLKTARINLDKEGYAGKVTLRQAYSQSFNPENLFELNKPLDKIIFSYALSIIPPWQESIAHALELLPGGGEIHIVDFYGQDDLPSWFRKFFFWWLKMFHVYHKPEIFEYLKLLEYEEKGKLTVESLYKGYAYHAVFKKNQAIH